MRTLIRSFAAGFALGTMLMFALSSAQAAPGNAARGAALYLDNCTGCHSLDANRVGPAHRGVYGRKVGSAPGFDYSPKLIASRVVWREATLDRWLINPQAFIPGARMGFRLSDPQKRTDIIAYLRQESGTNR